MSEMRKGSRLRFDRDISFGETLVRGIDFIEYRSVPANAERACRTIEKFLGESRKFSLFQKYFPAEWNASRTSFVRKGFFENYSERCEEFFRLVDENLFPILTGWNEDPEAEFDPFGIFSLNIDLCCADIEYEYVRSSYLAGLLIFTQDEEIWKYFENHHSVRRSDLLAISVNCHENLWNIRKTPENTPYLNLFEVIDHSTGNPWLDLRNCCHYEQGFEWNEETVDFLSNSYKQAEEILEQIHFLDGLFEANPGKILSDLIHLWNIGKFGVP
jgi:hypothetical protein